MLAALVIAIVLILMRRRRPSAHAERQSILAGIVLPNEDIRNFFLAHGMPAELGAAGAEMPAQDLANVNIDRLRELRRTDNHLAKWYMHKVDGVYYFI